MAYLEDHPPARSQFRATRRADETGCVVLHSAENTPDFVAFDGGAEAVARFIQTRNTAGSYHELVDSDSRINLIRDSAEAYGDGTGSNAWAWHLSVATRADVWPLAPQSWRDGAVEQAAQAAAGYAHRLHERTGITIPARRITRAESEAGVPGFISHGERDPGRRHDPGAEFPWDAFLARYSTLTADLNGKAQRPQPPPVVIPKEGEMFLIRRVEDGRIALGGPGLWRELDGEQAGVAAAITKQAEAIEANARQFDIARDLCLS